MPPLRRRSALQVMETSLPLVSVTFYGARAQHGWQEHYDPGARSNSDGSLETTINALNYGKVFSFDSSEGPDTVIKDLILTNGQGALRRGDLHPQLRPYHFELHDREQ